MIRIATILLLLVIALPAAALAQTAGPPNVPTVATIATGPVHVALGDVAASIIEWTMAAFGPLISAAVLWLVTRTLKATGLKNTDLLKDQLQRIVVNGVNAGAAKAQDELRGRAGVDIKSATARNALWYAQTHGAGIIKALGLDPQSGEAVEAIKARIETALADPAAPTNPAVAASTAPRVSASAAGVAK